MQHEVAIAQEVFEKFSKCICCAFILQSGDRQKQQEKQQRERKRIIKVCELQDYISFAIDLVSTKSALYRKIGGRYIYIYIIISYIYIHIYFTISYYMLCIFYVLMPSVRTFISLQSLAGTSAIPFHLRLAITL